MPAIRERSTYIAGNAWFICDRCAQRWRRSQMLTEWDNLKVCPVCIDPRPPQMSPPLVFPEGLPFPDSRPPQDLPDRLQDGSALQAITGGVGVSVGVQPIYPSGQTSPDGALSPQNVLENPLPEPSANVLEDDVTIRTGPVRANP
jgi:hypothetical protein